MTSFLWTKASSVSPPPRPVTASTSTSSNAASTAEEVEVLPMPISPMPSKAASASMAIWAPVRMACSAWARVMAGPAAMLPVPAAMRLSSTAGSFTGIFTPISQTVTPQPNRAASTAAPVLHRVRLIVCCKVTIWGVLATPSATTPLSAAKTSSCFLARSLCSWPVMPASWMESSSSRPRLPGGLASWACRRAAASMAARSRGRMVPMSCSRFCIQTPSFFTS